MPRLLPVLVLVWIFVPALAGAAERVVDGIAAQVDGRIVLVSDVMRSVEGREAAMREAGAPESEIAKLRADALERLIEAKLIEKLVERAELSASEEEINATIEQIAADNGLTVEQLYASVVFHGLSVEEYRGQIKRDLERRNLVNGMLGSKVEVTDAEVEAYYREQFADQPQDGQAVHVRQILRAYGQGAGRDEAEACAQAEEARARVLAGEPFEQVASAVSEVAPLDGGDIGWLPLDSVAPWMRGAIEPLEPGGTSDVIVLPFGCAVLQLVERRELEPVTFEQARDRLHRDLWEQKLASEYRTWMEDLRSESFIDRRGYFAEAANF